MKPFLEYLGTLLHILGIVLFVGGQVWFGLLSALAERHRDREARRFLTTSLPLMANVFGVGVVLLFGSGLLKLLVWGEPGLIFLPDPYGWIFLSKLLLYMIIVGNGILIERRYLPRLLSPVSVASEAVSVQQQTIAWEQITMRARINLVLTLVVVALGEAMRFSRL
jgi:uncharacterized membrane protein